MKTAITPFVYAATLILILGTMGCSKSQFQEQLHGTTQGYKVTFSSNDSSCIDLIAGQNIYVGSLCLDDIDTDGDAVDDALVVSVASTGSWKIEGVAGWFGCSSCMPPTNKKGNPVPGQFPYKSEGVDGQYYSFTIPFSELEPAFSCPYNSENYRGAMHLNVVDTANGSTQTAWAAGDRIVKKGNWGMFFGFNITCDEIEEPPTDNCLEVAWGRDVSANTCLSDVSCIGDDSWGWSNGIYTGNNTDTLELWVSAAGCSVAMAVQVGEVILSRNGSTLTVKYITDSDHPLAQVHFYAGSTETAQSSNCIGDNPNDACYTSCNTVIPAELGYSSDELNTTTYTFNVSVSGDYYAAAYADVGGFPCVIR